MDKTLYKDLLTARGLTYHYFAVPAESGKPTLLLLHGFPSTSYDWRYQVAYFRARGYGLIVPDLLGYGGTAKPADPAAYVPSLICKDILNILDAEGVATAVAVGHDWGSKIASRLANYHADRFTAFAFFALSYYPPAPKLDVPAQIAGSKALVGYEMLGYWLFLVEDEAEPIVTAHWDSFTSLIWTVDPKQWITDFLPTGALKAHLLADKQTPVGAWLSPEDRKFKADALLHGGLTGPFNWYKVLTTGLNGADDAAVPADKYGVDKPVFYGALLRDPVSLPAIGKRAIAGYCPNATVREFDTGHWVLEEAPEEVNKELLAWLEGLQSKL